MKSCSSSSFNEIKITEETMLGWFLYKNWNVLSTEIRWACASDYILISGWRFFCARSRLNVIKFWQHFWTVLWSSLTVSSFFFWRNDSSDLQTVYLQKRLEMPSNEVELLSYRRRESQRHPVNIRRTVSEDCLLDEHEDNHRLIISAFSMLKLSKTRISVGDSVTVYWDIREHCGANDWIGLFDLGE